MANADVSVSLPWYRTLSKPQWSALVGSNLGWVFDGYETYALILVVGVALRQLLDPAEYSHIPVYAGTVVALTLLGWAIGGLLGGIIADYIGRKRTMIFAILGYSLLTGLSAFAWDWTSFAAMRFIVGLAIGSEWVTGTSIVAEFFPDRARGRGVGYFQVGFGIGFFLAAFIFMFVGGLGPNAWRWMFAIGVLPALLTLWIRRNIPESTLWERSDRERQAARERQRAGTAGAKDQALTRFTLSELFADPETRRRTLLAFMIGTASTLSYWGISTWVPPYIGAVAQGAGFSTPLWISYAGMAFNFGGIIGYIGLGYLADSLGRRPTTLIYQALSLVLTPVLFLWTSGLGMLLLVAALLGVFVAGQFTWMSAWLPELYPTRMRGLGIATGSSMNRLASIFSPFAVGALLNAGYGIAAVFGMFAVAGLIGLVALIVLGVETKGRTLEDLSP